MSDLFKSFVNGESFWEDDIKSGGIKKKEIKKSVKIEIVNKNFFNFHEYAVDEFWKEVFLKASKNKFPRFFSYNNGHLIYKTKNTLHKLDLSESEENENTWVIVADFFRRYGNISSEENDSNKHMREKVMLSRNTEDILDIKKKKLKEILILNYIYKLKEDYNLTYDQTKEVETLINFGISDKKIQKNDFVIENGIITNIKNVTYDEEEEKFVLSNMNKKTVGNTKIIIDEKILEDFYDENSTSTIYVREPVNLSEKIKNTILNILDTRCRKKNKSFQSFTIQSFTTISNSVNI